MVDDLKEVLILYVADFKTIHNAVRLSDSSRFTAMSDWKYKPRPVIKGNDKT